MTLAAAKRLCASGALLAALLGPLTAVAETPTLEQVLARVQDDVPLALAAQRPHDAERARAEAAAPMPGPQLGAHARVVAAGETELELSVGQSFPLGRARTARREAGLRRADAIRLRSVARLDERRADVADTFYSAVLLRERLKAFEAQQAVVQRAHDALARRREAGDVAVYDVERMQREVRRLEVASERERIAHDSAVASVAAAVGADSFDGVGGPLRPSRCGGEAPGAAVVEAWQRDREANELEAEAARSSWLPTIGTETGWVGVMGGGALEHGVLARVTLAFPFWFYGDHVEQAFTAQAAASGAEEQLTARDTRAAAARSQALCERLSALAERAADGVAASEQLVARAEAGYAAAELSLLELVDAQAALLEDRLRHLDLLAGARQAQNDWARFSGGWR